VQAAAVAAVAGASSSERDAGGRGNAGSMLSMLLRENEDGARMPALHRRRFEDRRRPMWPTLTKHRHSVLPDR
jgi:hypothetical protein